MVKQYTPFSTPLNFTNMNACQSLKGILELHYESLWHMIPSVLFWWLPRGWKPSAIAAIAHMAGLQDTHASCDFGHRCWQPYPKGTGSWNHLDLCGLFQTHTHRGFIFNNCVVLVVNWWGRRGWWLNMIIRKLPMCLVLFQATSRYFSDQTWSDFIHAWLSPVRLYLWWRKWLGTWWVSNLILQKINHTLPLVWVST